MLSANMGYGAVQIRAGDMGYDGSAEPNWYDDTGNVLATAWAAAHRRAPDHQCSPS